MSLHPQFQSDFSNPARFYKAVSVRSKRNPVFLQRLLRPRVRVRRFLPKFISVRLSGFVPKCQGLLTAWLISLPTATDEISENVISVVSLKEIPLEEGERLHSDFFLRVSWETGPQADNSVRDLIVVMTFVPILQEETSVSKGDSDAVKYILKQFLDGVDPELDQMHICGLDMSLQLAKWNVHISNVPSKAQPMFRNWMSPVYGKSQEIVLSTDPRNSTTCSSISGNIEISWSANDCLKVVPNNSNGHDNGHDESKADSGNRKRNGFSDCPKSSTNSSSSSSTKVSKKQKHLVYYYMYLDPETQTMGGKPEIKKNIDCLWCGAQFGSYCESSQASHTSSKTKDKGGSSSSHLDKSTVKSINSLLIHLKNCHYHFEYHPMKDNEGNIFIFMQRDRKQDLDASSLQTEKMRSYYWIDGLTGDRGSLSIRDLPMIKVSADSLLPNSEANADTAIKPVKLLMTRQYYHPRTGLPLVPEELGYESDEECVSWLSLMQNNCLLDEFEDIGYEEKTFMKMWNAHVLAFPPYADLYFPYCCKIFAQRFAVQMVDQNLRYHFLFHLIAFWEFGLLLSFEVQYLIAIVDKRVKEKQDELDLEERAATQNATNS